MAKRMTGLFFDHMHEAAAMCEMVRDEAGNIIDWIFRDANKVALRGIGMQREDMVDGRAGELFGQRAVDWITGEYQHLRCADDLGEDGPGLREENFLGRSYLISSFIMNETTIGMVATDISQDKLAEEQINHINERLTASKGKYREIAEAITDPFTEYDIGLRLVYHNKASRGMTGLPEEESIGKTFAELYPDLVGTETHQIYLRALETRQPQRGLIRWVRPADRAEFFVDLSVYPTREGLVAFAKDITDRARASEELRKAHDRAVWMARLPGENPHPVMRVSLDGIILYRNRAAMQWAGGSATEGGPIGEPLQSLLEEAKAQDAKIIRDVLIDGRHYSVTLVPFMADGYANLYGLDITERKWAEEALRRSEERFYKAFQSSPVAMGITRLSDGRFIDVNASYYQVCGFTRDEVIGRTGVELGIYIDTDQRAELMRLLGEQGSIRNYEMRIRSKSGEVMTGLFSLEAIELDGEPCILTTAIDISERKRTEEALRESQQRERARVNELETLMDAVPVMIWISRDPECRQMTGNLLGNEFLQMGPDANVSVTAPEAALAAQPYRNMKDGHELAPTEMPMQVAAATGQPARDYTFDLVFNDGTLCHLMGNVNPLFDADGKPYGAVGAFMDVTLLRKMQARQVEARAQIEVQHRLMEYREQERQGIARDLHDGPIQTLASTAFNLQFIKEAYQDPSLRVELEGIAYSIKNAIRELREVVNDLRPPSLIRFGLVRAIHMHAEDVQERHPEVEIALDLAEEQDHLSEQACLTLFRIFQEALNNAVRHSGATRISVRYSIEQDDFHLEVCDNGRGFMVHPNLADIAGEGHFGLVGMRERALTVGAELSVTSAPGQGTTIQVRGPLLGKNIKE